MAFLGEGEMLVLEKNTGQVMHVMDGAVQGVALDLAVNFSSERGLLGIALHPEFENNGYVYLFWTCAAPPPTENPYFPTEIECADEPATGEDTDDVLAVPLLGNRVDRFVWDGSSLTWDMNLTKLRVFQNDGAPIPRGQGDEEQAALGNHDGGVMRFGPDGKLYIIFGDVGRRSALQNLPFGPIPYAEPTEPTPEPPTPTPPSETPTVTATSPVTPTATATSPVTPTATLPSETPTATATTPSETPTSTSPPPETPPATMPPETPPPTATPPTDPYLIPPQDESGVQAQDLPQDLLGLILHPYPVPDDQFGGPFPDDAHYTGVIMRLNDDGTIPEDNPFYEAGANIGGEIGENIQMTFAYGIRNSFGMDVDPVTGMVWMTENGEDAFDELNLVEPGLNSGWIQIMGPLGRIDQYKEIETTEAINEPFPNLQQFRWGPENIADGPIEAGLRLFRLPGSHFSNPEFSWKYATAPSAIGFVNGNGLGEAYAGDLFMGFSVPDPLGGPLFHMELREDRMGIVLPSPAQEDRVADNNSPRDLTESEPFLIGTDFGVLTDIHTGPDGNLYLVSLSNGAIYEISMREDPEQIAVFETMLTGAAEVPGPGDEDGHGMAWITVDESAGEVCFAITVSGITLPATGAHIHVGTSDVAGDVVVPLEPPGENGASSGCVTVEDADLLADIVANPSGYYVNVHTEDFPAGALRGQLPQDGTESPGS
jgi:glucose/arabinose dehydrogenase